jgi:hypothetical protein
MSLELSGTTGVKGVAGSVSAPSVVGDDTNTGISFPSADTIKFSTGGVERMSITNSGLTGDGSGLTGIGGGKILQVVQTQILTSSSTASQSFADTALVRTITPSSSSNKILCMVDMKMSGSGESFLKLVRFVGGTGYNIAYSTVNTTYTANQGFSSTYHTTSYGNYYDFRSVTVSTLDTAVSAAEHSYRVQWRAQQGTVYMNRTAYHTGTLNYSGSGCSTITLMEVAA